MNKALPIEKLRGAVFGEPLPNTFDESSTLISKFIFQKIMNPENKSFFFVFYVNQ